MAIRNLSEASFVRNTNLNFDRVVEFKTPATQPTHNNVVCNVDGSIAKPKPVVRRVVKTSRNGAGE